MMTRQFLSARAASLTHDTLKKCLWVDSGVVSYRLCDLEYNCESCPFDRVLRGDALWWNDRLDSSSRGEADSKRR